MNQVIPFQGWRHRLGEDRSASPFIAPPYDVFDDKLRQHYRALSEHNCVSLILPEAPEGGDKYAAAAQLWKTWRESGVLEREGKPSFYYARQHFTSPTGEEMMRSGFIGLLKIDDETESRGGIKGHERTLDGPKADRLKLFEATQANLSQVFSVYGDQQMRAEKAAQEAISGRAPDATATDHLGIKTEMWVIDDASTTEKMSQAMEDSQLMIADGHHRFETATNYRRRLAESGALTAESGANGVMIYFACLDQPGLKIFPIHRVLHSVPGLSGETLLGKLVEHFDLDRLPDDTSWSVALDRLGPGGAGILPAYAIRLKEGGWVQATLKADCRLDDLLSETPDSLRNLDVVALHRLIFERLLGISLADQAAKKNLNYHSSPETILGMLEKPDHQAIFFIRPPSGEDVAAVVASGEKMPQKSTYYYPKLLTGLVYNSLEDKLSR